VLASGLIDTGPMVALVDRDDRWHRACVETLEDLRLPLVTSTAVLTEAFHLVGDSARERAALWAFLRSGAVRVGEIVDAELPALEVLMTKYGDRSMDFADATLVHLAEREGLTDIFTIDHDDFDTYRIAGRRRFRIVPERRRPGR